MSYLGTPPQSGFITTAKQRVTSSTNAYVDLDHAISSIADVIVFVNFVKQDTTNLTLTTSTRITLGGTLVSSDVVEIHYLGKAVNTQTPATGTVTADALAGSIGLDKLSATGTKSSSTFLRGDNTFATVSSGEKNLPYFCANMNSNQECNANTFTTLQFNNETSDSSSCYNTSTYRFTPNVEGRYYISSFVRSAESEDHDNFQLAIYKNGSQTRLTNLRHLHYHTAHVDALIHMNGSSDYVEMKLSHDRSGASTIIGDEVQSQFQAFFVGNT